MTTMTAGERRQNREKEARNSITGLRPDQVDGWRPVVGRTFVELLPGDEKTEAGVVIPDTARERLASTTTARKGRVLSNRSYSWITEYRGARPTRVIEPWFRGDWVLFMPRSNEAHETGKVLSVENRRIVAILVPHY